MNRDDIIRMARECGLTLNDQPMLGVEHFANLVEQHLIESGYRKCAVGQRTTQFCGQLEAAVVAEREACAKVCEEHAAGIHGYDKHGYADAIREIGNAPALPEPGPDLEWCPMCGGPADRFDRWEVYACSNCAKA